MTKKKARRKATSVGPSIVIDESSLVPGTPRARGWLRDHRRVARRGCARARDVAVVDARADGRRAYFSIAIVRARRPRRDRARAFGPLVTSSSHHRHRAASARWVGARTRAYLGDGGAEEGVRGSLDDHRHGAARSKDEDTSRQSHSSRSESIPSTRNHRVDKSARVVHP